MSGVNIQIIMGNLGADVELRTTTGGTSVCDLRVAVGERVKKDGEWVDHTEWFRVTVWGKTAENAAKYLRKGSSVHIVGKQRTEKWTDKEGADRWTTKLVCDRLVFGPKSHNTGGGGGGGGGGKGGGGGGAMDDDIPF